MEKIATHPNCYAFNNKPSADIAFIISFGLRRMKNPYLWMRWRAFIVSNMIFQMNNFANNHQSDTAFGCH